MGRGFKVTSLLLLFAFLFVSGCSIPGDNRSYRMGRMEDRTYKNDYFKLSFNIPEDWPIATEQEKYSILTSSISEGDENSKKQLDYVMTRVLYLIYTSKYPPDFSDPNPNFQCYAERLSGSNSLSIRSGRDYLEITTEQMKKSGSPYTFSDITSEELDGKSFDMVYIEKDTGGTLYKLKFYSAILNGYAVNFIITYTENDGFSELDNIIKSIRFSWPVHEQQVVFFT